MLIKNLRLSFPNLFQPDAFDANQKPKFGATFILDKSDPQVAVIREHMNDVGRQKWGTKWDDQKFRSSVTACIRDGSDKSHLDGFSEDNIFFNASNPKRPTVVDRDRSAIAEEDGKIYAGCFVNASVEFWVQDNQYGKRINASLRGVQFAGQGEAFGGGGSGNVEDDFEDISGSDAEVVEEKATADFLA